MAEPLLRTLIDIPTEVHRGTFVLKLTEGVTPKQAMHTVGSYVVTPQLEQAFERALHFIDDALVSDRSKAAYLHGSFGSGKSHFMAVLHLLLNGHDAALGHERLQGVLAKNHWVGQKRFLLVPFHMVGKASLEQALYTGYIEHLQRLHPDAPPPALYRSDALFENAQALLGSLGEARFFETLNGAEGGDAAADDMDWGDLGGQTWDRARFDAAVASDPLDRERGELLKALVQTHFPAFQSYAHGEAGALIDIDHGLAEMAAHAKRLGYDAVVLFLDEVMLWLAGNASEPGFVSREGQKLAKLVESQVAERDVPLIGFLARQKPLRELIGETLDGAQHAQIDASMAWNDGRFAEITLEDRNLPVIAQERLLRPNSVEARAQLDAHFERMKRTRRDVLDTLMTQQGDLEMFRQVYPFSPALVQALVALSAALQRERSALRVMLQLLVDQRERLALGQVIPVGDLWDAIDRGTEPFSAEMSQRFGAARRLWREKMMPMLREQHGVEHPGQVSHPPTPAEKAAQNDARLLKTLLLAALVPEVEALRQLTPGRLASLNHGTVRTPIPGQEAATVLNKLKRWHSSALGELRMSGELNNPTVRLELTEVPIQQLLDAVQHLDTAANRRRLVIDRVLQQVTGKRPGADLLFTYTHRWRCVDRNVEVLFDNVRTLGDASLSNAGDEWRLIIDFPFDEEGKKPSSDVARADDFVAKHPAGSRCILWLPRFFSAELLDSLGRLVRIQGLLDQGHFDKHSHYLPAARRQEAQNYLTSIRTTLNQRLDEALRAAYGLSRTNEDDLLADPQEHTQVFRCLLHGLRVRPPAKSDLRGALADVMDQAYAFQFPSHPEFDLRDRDKKQELLTARLLKKVWGWCSQALEHDNFRLPQVDRTDRALVRAVVEPLHLGTMADGPLVLDTRRKDELEKARLSAQVDDPTVAQLYEWLDPESQRSGLPTEVMDLVILVYAGMTHRSFMQHNVALDVDQPGKLKRSMSLPRLGLPSDEVWRKAVLRAEALFGATPPGTRLAVRNVTGLAQKVRKAAEGLAGAVDFPGTVQARADQIGRPLVEGPRLRITRGLARLHDITQAEDALSLLKALVELELPLADSLMAREAAMLGQAIGAAGREDAWEVVSQLQHIQDQRRERAQGTLDDLASALGKAERDARLKPALDAAYRDALDILTPKPPPGWVTVAQGEHTETPVDWEALKAEVEKALAEHPDPRKFSISWTLKVPGK